MALGTWAFASNVYGGVTDSEAIAAVRAALDAGITFYDTAPMYGRRDQDGVSEILLGKGLGRDRDRVLVSTKFGRLISEGIAPHFDAEHCRRSVEDSLRRLGTDHVDLLFFHSPFSEDEIAGDIWEALDELRQAGKVRLVGHSISRLADTGAMCRRWAPDVSVQARGVRGALSAPE